MSGTECVVNGVRPDVSNMTIGGQQQKQISSNETSQQQQEDDMQTEEAIAPRQVANVIQPTQQERDQHNLFHLPFRDWCEDCVKGKACERNFSKVSHEPTCLPCFHADYMFVGEQETDGTTPILTLRDD